MSEELKPYAPKYVFADPVGPWLRTFAWRPYRMWDNRIIWLKWFWRQRMAVPMHLTPGGGDSFWRYTDLTTRPDDLRPKLQALVTKWEGMTCRTKCAEELREVLEGGE